MKAGASGMSMTGIWKGEFAGVATTEWPFR